TQNEAYPHYAPLTRSHVSDGLEVFGDVDPLVAEAFPKFWAVLEELGINGTHVTNWGVQAYVWEADEVWEKALCPSMDAAEVFAAADAAADTAGGVYYDGKPSLHRAAAGYQWN
ncbi:unnamed protein product, partial [marine sediment metagenome]